VDKGSGVRRESCSTLRPKKNENDSKEELNNSMRSENKRIFSIKIHPIHNKGVVEF